MISAGAPVPPAKMALMRSALHPDAEIYTPYGATESLPLCSISCSALIKDGEKGLQEGKGVCVGTPIEGVNIEIIPITDDAILTWTDTKFVPKVRLEKSLYMHHQPLNPMWMHKRRMTLLK